MNRKPISQQKKLLKLLFATLHNFFSSTVARLIVVVTDVCRSLSCSSDCGISSSPTSSTELKQIPVLQKRSNTYYLSGRLSVETVPLLWQQSQDFLKDLQQTPIVFDLEKVTHSDSSGIALLIAWTRNFHHRSQVIRFVHLPRQMLAIIQLAGLGGIMPIGGMQTECSTW